MAKAKPFGGWSAEISEGNLVVNVDGPIPYADGLQLAAQIVMLCRKGFGVTSASKVATAPAGGGKAPKGGKKTGGKI